MSTFRDCRIFKTSSWLAQLVVYICLVVTCEWSASWFQCALLPNMDTVLPVFLIMLLLLFSIPQAALAPMLNPACGGCELLSHNYVTFLCQLYTTLSYYKPQAALAPALGGWPVLNPACSRCELLSNNCITFLCQLQTHVHHCLWL